MTNNKENLGAQNNERCVFKILQLHGTFMHGVCQWNMDYLKNRLKTTGSSEDVVSAACSRLYSVRQGKKKWNIVISREQEVGGQINEMKKNCLKRLQRMPSERANFYYQQIGKRDPVRPGRRWLNCLMFEDETGWRAQPSQKMMVKTQRLLPIWQIISPILNPESART